VLPIALYCWIIGELGRVTVVSCPFIFIKLWSSPTATKKQQRMVFIACLKVAIIIFLFSLGSEDSLKYRKNKKIKKSFWSWKVGAIIALEEKLFNCQCFCHLIIGKC